MRLRILKRPSAIAAVLAAATSAMAGAVLAPTAGAAALTQLTPAGTWPSPPIHAASPLEDPRLFVVERGGTVRIMVDGVLRPDPFLTVPGVDTTGERGLLSIAFPYDHATSGKVYVFASIGGTPAQTRVIEYRVSPTDPNVVDPTSARVVLTQDLSSATNHNGGQLAFGPDRRLYVTVGDNTAPQYAQRVDSFLGKVLRIDPVDPDGAGPATYAVPADNPFAGNPVWALGLRNPYRASFDPSGRLIIADVGEGTVEEVNIGASGANFGWPLCEGAVGDCSSPTLTGPFHSYLHSGADQGCSIIGGIVVRDARLTGLSGRYLFGDYCQGDARSIDLGAGGPGARKETISAAKVNGLWGYAEDARGCAYVLGNGTISRIVATSGDPKACTLPYLEAPPIPTPGPTATPSPTPSVPIPTSIPVPRATPVPTPTPAPTPGPVATPTPTPKPSVKLPIPRNCVRAAAMSLRSSKGTITKVRLVKGKTTKAVKFKRNGVRVELRGLPAAGSVKLRLTIRTKRKRVLVETKTYKAC